MNQFYLTQMPQLDVILKIGCIIFSGVYMAKSLESKHGIIKKIESEEKKSFIAFSEECSFKSLYNLRLF